MNNFSNLTFAQKIILKKAKTKYDIMFQDYYEEHEESYDTDYNDSHSDYYDAE